MSSLGVPSTLLDQYGPGRNSSGRCRSPLLPLLLKLRSNQRNHVAGNRTPTGKVLCLPVRLGAARRSFRWQASWACWLLGLRTRRCLLELAACGLFGLRILHVVSAVLLESLGWLARHANSGGGLCCCCCPWCFSSRSLLTIPLLSNTVLVVSVIWLPEPQQGVLL